MEIKRENFGLVKSSLRPIICIQGLGFVGSAMSVAVANSREKNNIIFDVIGLEQPTSEGKNRAKSINKGSFFFNNVDKSDLKGLKYAIKNKI